MKEKYGVMTKRVGIVCAILTVVFWGCDGGSDSAVTNAADSAQNDSAQAEGESVASVTRSSISPGYI